MKNNSEKKYIGTLSQTELLKLYAKHVNKPKVQIFKQFGFAVIPGKRSGIYFKTLSGSKKGQPPMEIINCRSSGGVFNLGHRHPEIVNELKNALNAGLDLGDHMLLSEQRALLGRQLAELLPGDLDKTTFGVSGGEAIDSAIKFSRAYTKRKGCISAIGGYHGHTGFALLTGDPDFKDTFLWNNPDFAQVPFGNLDAMEKAINEDVACVILEGIPATGGVLIAHEGYFPGVRELCDKYGVMLILDEVQSGLGRTGEFWSFDGGLYPNDKIVPDFVVCGKGMSSGIYPLSTCSYKSKIEKSIFKEDPFIHISTTGGSDLGCAVASKMLEIQSDPDFLAHVKKMGELFGTGLRKIQEDHSDLIKEVRGRGLMWGIEFYEEIDGQLNMLHCINEGVLLNYCGNNKATDIIMPPLIITQEQLTDVLDKISNAITRLSELKKS
ncbi:MAG: aminotransferase class III-fold pyridoxal phosphate-dependent enzyme [Candidatus Lokiarchaeota archaeon]|nr:aminotransferase class III-fold pyridoxal phosphate-dependent enzyme [Candidatus Lokiarchaeota archaeon]